MARQGEKGPYREGLRRTLEVSLANRKAADDLLDAIVELQSCYNALLAKLDADAGVVDTDYESSLEVTPVE